MTRRPCGLWIVLATALVASACACACGGGTATAESPAVVNVGEGAREEGAARETAPEAARPGTAKPDLGPFKDDLAVPLNLEVLITAEGIRVVTSSGAIAEGCRRLGGSITLPASDGAHDLTGLTACARRLKEQSPELAKETQVTVKASPTIAYAVVIKILDALRGEGDEELFPVVTVGALSP